MRVDACGLVLAVSAAGWLSAANPPAASKTATPAKLAAPQAPNASAFAKAVTPVLGTTCTQCHNSQFASGGFDAGPFLAPSSVLNQRDGWDRILLKVRSGEMPPKGIPRSEAEIETLVKYVQGEFDRSTAIPSPIPAA